MYLLSTKGLFYKTPIIGDRKSPIQFDSEINTQTPFYVCCVSPPIEAVLPLLCGRAEIGSHQSGTG
jgi:hypothetical protein